MRATGSVALMARGREGRLPTAGWQRVTLKLAQRAARDNDGEVESLLGEELDQASTQRKRAASVW